MGFCGPVPLWPVFHMRVVCCSGGTTATFNRADTNCLATATVGVGVDVGLAVGVGIGLAVGVGVAVATAVTPGGVVGVGASVGVAVGASVTTGRGVGVAVGAGVGVASAPQARINKVSATTPPKIIERPALLDSALRLPIAASEKHYCKGPSLLVHRLGELVVAGRTHVKMVGLVVL